MNNITCFECGNPSGQHKLSCDSRTLVETVQLFSDSLEKIPTNILTDIAFKINISLMERDDDYMKQWENKDATKS